MAWRSQRGTDVITHPALNQSGASIKPHKEDEKKTILTNTCFPTSMPFVLVEKNNNTRIMFCKTKGHERWRNECDVFGRAVAAPTVPVALPTSYTFPVPTFNNLMSHTNLHHFRIRQLPLQRVSPSHSLPSPPSSLCVLWL